MRCCPESPTRCASVTFVKRLAAVGALVVNAVLLLSACSSPITVPSLDDAAESGEAPTIESWAYRGVIGIEVDWEQDPSARGWQIQYSPDDGKTWVDQTSDAMLGPDAAAYTGADVQWATKEDVGDRVTVRVRKVLDPDTVSPWTVIGPVPTAESLPPLCLGALRMASQEVASGSEGHLERSLNACTTKEEWATAAQMFPGAIGLTVASRIDALAGLSITCRSYPLGAVCF